MYALHVRHICRYIYSRVLMARLTTKGNTAQHFGFMAGVSRVSGLYYYSLLLLFTTALCYYTLPQHFGFMTGASKVSGLYYYSLLLLMTTAFCYYEYTLYYEYVYPPEPAAAIMKFTTINSRSLRITKKK